MEDCRRGVKNITEWLDLVFKPKNNQYGVTYKQFVAAEQEFNTATYGIKGIIDGIVVLKDNQGVDLVTALEIKTGKNHLSEHRS